MVAAKNALSTFLTQQQQPPDQYVTAPFPTLEFNRGALVDVDFTSDDPADANFIIDTMNRIQSGPNMIQIPLLSTGGPLSALSTNGNNGNGTMKAPSNNKQIGNENDTEKGEKESGKGKENTHNDSGLVDGEPEGEEMEYLEQEGEEEDELGTLSRSLLVEEGTSDEEDGDEEEEVTEGDVELTAEILEIIRLSVEHFIEYDSEIQCKYSGERIFFSYNLLFYSPDCDAFRRRDERLMVVVDMQTNRLVRRR